VRFQRRRNCHFGDSVPWNAFPQSRISPVAVKLLQYFPAPNQPGTRPAQPTALINETFLRLLDQSQPVQWENRAHFFGIAARPMRTILVDHARARHASSGRRRSLWALRLCRPGPVWQPGKRLDQKDAARDDRAGDSLGALNCRGDKLSVVHNCLCDDEVVHDGRFAAIRQRDKARECAGTVAIHSVRSRLRAVYDSSFSSCRSNLGFVNEED